MPIQLPHANGKDCFRVDLTPTELILIDPAGQVVARVNADNGEGRFRFPSVLPWGDDKLGIKADDGNIRWFLPDDAALADIKDHLNQIMPDCGPGAMAAHRAKAWLCLGLGVGLTLGGSLLALVLWNTFFRFPAIFLGTLGLALGSFGMQQLNRGGRFAPRT